MAESRINLRWNFPIAQAAIKKIKSVYIFNILIRPYQKINHEHSRTKT